MTTTLQLSIDGMNCASCVGRADRALQQVAGVTQVSVNLASETARIAVESADAARAAMAALDQVGYPARSETRILRIETMSCASCVGRVQGALNAVPGVIEAQVNLASETAQVTFAQGALTGADLARASAAAGYPAQLAEGSAAAAEAPDRKVREASALLRRLWIALALTLPVFVMEMGGHLAPALHHWIDATIGRQMSWGLQFLLTTAVLAGPGRMFYTRGLPALWRGAPDMNSLVAVGTGAAYLYSVVATFLPGLLPEAVRAVYFEAAAVIVVLILLGRALEARAKGRTGAAIRGLMDLQAPTARRLASDGSTQEIALEDVRPGDLVLAHPGERIAVDGEVAEGRSHVDESLLTGEAAPIVKSPGDAVTGGTMNGTGSLQIRVTRTGADTTLAHIVRMVADAQGARLPIQGLVDRITLWFVPAVMAVAVLTGLAWLVFGPDPVLTHALVAGVSVLIIACPCAMGLATPTSIMVGTGRAAQMGVLFRKGDALQHLAGAEIVALDKTGTLTQGRPALTELKLAPGFARADTLARIAAVEARSEHPLAQAVLRAARIEGLDLPEIRDFDSVTGQGVQAQVDGMSVRVGSERFLADAGIDLSALTGQAAELAAQGRGVVFAAVGDRVAALMGVADPVKPASRSAIAALRARGLEVAMITGDRAETAWAIARETGIDRVIADVLPQGKVDALDQLRAEGRRVAFVGDGINDAPALAHADIGIAIGTGTDVAIESADVVLMSGDLRGVVNAVEVSARTLRNIRQNLFWAFAYNGALIPVAAGALYPAWGVLLSPALAAGAMALSSVFVLSNALRLRRIAPAMAEDGADLGTPAAAVPAPARA
ncbi:heavy metal translocating P-type ATPase [Pseudooceanicola aestuarii]|uniref:heavy metal translocating P-type ATPase n=1 Tax=Pseudooceanicola aestuarii TaxID=2697319 RepID=UPI0013D6CF59|nr:heavy metal translocating P-type ATPase [Pseudooceanicola aestuarii]